MPPSNLPGEHFCMMIFRRSWVVLIALLCVLVLCPASLLGADPFTCDLQQYKAGAGPSAELRNGALLVTWQADAGAQLRAEFGIDAAQPTIRELAIRSRTGQNITLGRNLVPEFEV